MVWKLNSSVLGVTGVDKKIKIALLRMALKDHLHAHQANCVSDGHTHTELMKRELKRNQNFNPHITHFYGNKSAAEVLQVQLNYSTKASWPAYRNRTGNNKRTSVCIINDQIC